MMGEFIEWAGAFEYSRYEECSECGYVYKKGTKHECKIRGEHVEFVLNDNRIVILRALTEMGRTTRGNLCAYLNLPRTTVYNNLCVLQEHGLVKSTKEERRKRGRPKTFWELEDDIINVMIDLKFEEDTIQMILLGMR